MARPMKPLVRGGGYYPSNGWTPLVYAGGYTTANGGEEPAPPPIEKTVTGNPIHITDALAKPVQALSIALEPIQDLNGYDNPWPAGGGVNILPPCSINKAFDPQITNDGLGSYTINGTATGYGQTVANESFFLDAGTYTLFSNTGASNKLGVQLRSVDGTTIYAASFSEAGSFTLSERTEVKFRIVFYAGTFNTTISPTLNKGSSVSPFSPYSNICPISGHTDADVTRTGKNLLNASDFLNKSTKRRCTATVTNDIITVTCTEAGQVWVGSQNAYVGASLANDYVLHVNGGETIIASTKNGSSVASYLFIEANENKVVIKITNASATATLQSDTKYVAIRAIIENSMTPGAVWTDAIQIELGSTATAYEPYQGETYSIAFPSSAGTVYGGTLDVTTGKLTVDRAYYTWQSGGYLTIAKAFAISKADVININPQNQTTLIGAICDKLKGTTWADIASRPTEYSAGCVYGNGLAIRIPDFTTAEEYTAWLAKNTPSFCYLLNTPIEITLTPTQVTTLLGTNNVWSDTNGDIELTYYADGNASDEEALNILLGGRYVNNHTEDEPSDREALDILLGGNAR